MDANDSCFSGGNRSEEIILLKYATVSYSLYAKYHQISYLRQASQEINGALFSQTRQ
jgi:hypothetical protein